MSQFLPNFRFIRFYALVRERSLDDTDALARALFLHASYTILSTPQNVFFGGGGDSIHSVLNSKIQWDKFESHFLFTYSSLDSHEISYV